MKRVVEPVAYTAAMFALCAVGTVAMAALLALGLGLIP